MAALAALLKEAEAWQALDFCEETRAQVSAAVAGNDEAALQSAFGKRIEFGTAGLRAEMGAGPARMNDLVVVQTAQGMCAYLETQLGADVARTRGVVLGYDHRMRGSLNSKRFAVLSAAAFLSRGFTVYLFGALACTPLVPFATTQKNACAGVMVTASHNPKQDDGYKVYWGNGCQIIPPHDAGIAASILLPENLAPWPAVQAVAGGYAAATEASVRASATGRCEDPFEEVCAAYFAALGQQCCHHRAANAQPASSLKVAYTAMHGVGLPFAERSFAAFGLAPFVPVAAQVQPDPEFPTVAFPNPEEGEGALKLAMETADAGGCTLILANDPDADRLAVAEKDAASGKWRIFSGNETAALLGHWLWRQYQARPAAERSAKGAAMVASTVSSKFLRAMAAKEGFRFEECLTGFKWIGNASLDLRAQGHDVLFGYEEAIGFCVGAHVADKDGITAMSVFAEMAGQLKAQGSTCAAHLLVLGDSYGHFVTNNSYVISHDAAANKKAFLALGSGGAYATHCGKYKVAHVRDLCAPGFDSAAADKTPSLPVSSSHMLTFTFENGCVATLRMSGTEPKLKWYAEMSGEDPVAAKAELDDLVETGIKGDWLKSLIQ